MGSHVCLALLHQRRKGRPCLSLGRIGVSVAMGLLILVTIANPVQADNHTASPTKGSTVVSFCLQPPLAGTITFSNLTLSNTPPPVVRATASGLPPGQTLGILWAQVPGHPHGGLYLVANITTNQSGQAMLRGKGFRQPDFPAKRILLARIENRRSVHVGEGIPCTRQLPDTGGVPASADYLLAILGLGSMMGGLAIRQRV